MDKKIRIHITVGESRYPLWVDRTEEPIFREAARMVNRRLTAYSTKFRSAHLSPETILAMAAVDLAVLAQRQELQLGSAADMDDLDALTSDLKDFLGKAPDDSAAL